jgi:hypothetical protein
MKEPAQQKQAGRREKEDGGRRKAREEAETYCPNILRKAWRRGL